MIGILTGTTCGFACWQAQEEICRCSCAGANHGILRMGGLQPQRTAKIDGQFYELVAILPFTEKHSCYAEFDREAREELRRITDERFPDLDAYAYGQWREEKTLPILDRKVSETQKRWPEVQAVKGAQRLIWARPAGSAYRRRSDRKQAA